MLTQTDPRTGRRRSLAWLLALALVALTATRGVAQETADPAAEATATEAAPTDEAAPAAEPEAETPEEPAAEASNEEPPSEEEAPEATGTETPDAAADEAATEDEAESSATDATTADDEAATDGGSNFLGVLVTLAVIILPILLGNWLAKKWRLPEQAWRLSTILLAFAVAGLCVRTGTFKGGPDLAGGITLVYEVDRSNSELTSTDKESGPQASSRGDVDIDALIAALKLRVDPTGTKEVSIRNYGGAVEIIIPKAGTSELQYIKKRLTDLGQLEFRITADPRWAEDRPLIEKALTLEPSEKLVFVGEKARGKWIPYNELEFSENDSRLVQRTAGSRREALVKIDRYDVTGEYLENTSKGYGDVGQPIVLFNFDNRGARLFGKFTGENLEQNGVKRFLGIVLDNRLISAPTINDRITGSGQIDVRGKEEEVDSIIDVLNAGSLPAALNETPISEELVSPTLGAETIKKGRFAITVSLIAVLAFIVLYYQFAGLVAALALAGTLLLVLAGMVAIQAAFTLPGLAGLVLTVGMAVDANVLIFERIREETKKGAGLRMAIRNGFDKATTTIVDANVTTLIAAVVLYSVGTGPIKGFGVTLFLGIVMSMFTAIFCSRTLFDVAERKRTIKNLSFGSILGETSIDFLGKRGLAAVVSIALIGLGLAGVFSRGSDLLNIDFTGGSSVTMLFDESSDTSFSEVKDALEATDLENLTIVERGDDSTRFTVNTRNDDVDAVEMLLAETFGEKLKTYSLDIGTAEAYEATGGSTGTIIPLAFNQGEGFGENDGLTHDALLSRITAIVAEQGHEGVLPQLENGDYTEGSSQRFKDWDLRLGSLSTDQATAVAEALQTQLSGEVLFPLASKIGSRVAGDLQVKAISAILLSLLGIVAYLWFRFQNPWYGLAAVVALVHDVLVTLGAIALSAWVVSAAPPLAQALQLDAFQISLPILAAFITIIGYSLNDTIVVFDRVREVKGKSPRLTAGVINKSVNQTLSRTLLTSLTTLIVVVILYLFGGAGIHAFAFALVIGVIVGTYSSIFVASPALLAMAGAHDDTTE